MSQNKSKIDAVVLDLGGVIVGLNWATALDALGIHDLKKREAFPRTLDAWTVYDQYERGLLETDRFFDLFIQEFSIDLDRASTISAWDQLITGPIPSVDSVLKDLSSSVPVYALSNTNLAHYDHVVSTCRSIDYFKKIYTSFHFGRRKPELAIFDCISSAIQVPSESILFIDDSSKNVEGAILKGFQSEICFNSAERLKEIFKAYSLLG